MEMTKYVSSYVGAICNLFLNAFKTMVYPKPYLSLGMFLTEVSLFRSTTI